MSERSSDGSDLIPRQKVFCQEYIVDLNRTRAAIRAGYSEHSARQTGSELLAKPEIQDYVDHLMAERAARTAITSDYVLGTIRDTVERCRQAEKVMEWDPIAKEMAFLGEWRFEHAGVLKGCELLGKHLKLFADRVEHSGPNGKPIEHKDMTDVTDEQLDAKIQAMLAKRAGKPDGEA